MAKKDREPDKDEDENQDQDQTEEDQEGELKVQPSAFKMLLIGVFVTLLLVGLSVGGTLFFVMSKNEPTPNAATGEQAAEETTAEDAAPVEEALPIDRGPPRYIRLDPPFTINLADSTRMLRVSMTVLVYGDGVESAFADQMPRIRNGLVEQLGDLNADQISDRRGKEALRAAILASIRATLADNLDPLNIEEVFFTDFVMQ